MLYPLTRLPAKILLGTYFRKISISNSDRIPKGEAVILAANHPTAFIEPCILACWLDDPLYFLVRGDLFSKPFYARILEAYHMIAVYRLKDGGYSKIRNNYGAFEKAFRVLSDMQPLMILAEGSTRHEKRLRPLQKGTGRLALGALDNGNVREVYVVPVGVNFTSSNQPRTEAMISIGEPMAASTFLAEYQENNNQGILALTEELRRRLLQEVLVVEDPDRDSVAELYFSLYRHDHPVADWPVTLRTADRLRHHQAIAEWVNQLPEDQFAALKEETETYRNALEEAGITDRSVSETYRKSDAGNGLMWLLLLPATLGYFLHWPLVALARDVVHRRVRNTEFKASVFIALILGLYPVLWALMFVVCSMAGSPFAAIFLPVLGYFYVIFRAKWNRFSDRRKWFRISNRKNLAARRDDLLGKLPAEIRKFW